MTLDELKKKKVEEFEKGICNCKFIITTPEHSRKYCPHYTWNEEKAFLLTTIDQTAKETLEANKKTLSKIRDDIRRCVSPKPKANAIPQDILKEARLINRIDALDILDQALSDHQSLADTFLGKEKND